MQKEFYSDKFKASSSSLLLPTFMAHFEFCLIFHQRFAPHSLSAIIIYFFWLFPTLIVSFILRPAGAKCYQNFIFDLISFSLIAADIRNSKFSVRYLIQSRIAQVLWVRTLKRGQGSILQRFINDIQDLCAVRNWQK